MKYWVKFGPVIKILLMHEENRNYNLTENMIFLSNLRMIEISDGWNLILVRTQSGAGLLKYNVVL